MKILQIFFNWHFFLYNLIIYKTALNKFFQKINMTKFFYFFINVLLKKIIILSTNFPIVNLLIISINKQTKKIINAFKKYLIKK